jgi:predicted MFS family arabinose efflux permease
MNGRAALGRIGVLMGAVFVDMMGFLMVLPLLPFYAERFGATPSLIGVLVAAHAFAQLTTAPLWGRLSDHWGRRPVILLGLFTSAIAYLLFGLASSLWLLLVSRLVLGAGGGINGVIQAYVSDAVGGADRARALGWLTAATSAGVMLGPALALFAIRLGPHAPGLIAAALALLNVAVAWRFLPEPARDTHHGGERKKLRHALVDVLRHPATPAHRMIWIYAAGMMAFMAMNGVLALYLGRQFGVTDQNIGFFYLYVGAISLVMRGGVLGPAVTRWGEVRVLQLGALALTLGLALITVPHRLVLLAAVVPLVPIGTAMLFPATTSQLSHHAPRGRLGETLGLQQTFGGVARMVGPIGAGAAFEHLGMRWPFWLAATLMAVAGTMALRVPRSDDPQEGNAAVASAVVPTARG